jgi:tRNA threonylcarbamoyladenosine biosynthesis protein TsaE
MPALPPSTFRTASPGETRALAERIAATLPDGAVILLEGELGAGKTCFAQGLARACGVRRPVTSPTFTLVNEYPGTVRPFAHMDLYRLASEDEAATLGLDDYLLRYPGLVAIEWPERAPSFLPPDAWRVTLSPAPDPSNPDARLVTLLPPAPTPVP